ncbi:MAG TPA: TolC family protein [Alphaproteobacteria bacterium]|nr:TolC family protein [Alphaproteobacteria bacterium]
MIRQRVLVGMTIVLACATALARSDTSSLAIQPAFAGPMLEATNPGTPGADLDELLGLVRGLSPDVAAAILEAQAAEAAAKSAGALDDPELFFSLEDVERSPGGLPEEAGTVFLGLEQRFPWWGKRRLRREVAQAQAGRSKSAARLVKLEIESRLKRAFADAWFASQAVALTGEIERDLRAIVESTLDRYAIGRARQGEVSEAEIALNAALTQKRRLQASLTAAKAEVNALLDRDPAAPLENPASLPHLPPVEAMTAEHLLARALTGSPALEELRSEIAEAIGDRSLAGADWYPDFTLGFTIVEGLPGDASDGYEASFRMNLPLQWGVRRARVSEASAKLSAAEHRLRAARRDLEASLTALLDALEAAQFEGEILSGPDLRQAEAALAAAEAAYPLGRAEIGEVLRARQAVKTLRLEHLRTVAEQQRLLADIELLIGGEL